jgi:hypothetical protein
MSLAHRCAHSRSVIFSPDVVWNVVSDHLGMVQWLPFGMSLPDVEGRAIRPVSAQSGHGIRAGRPGRASRRRRQFATITELPIGHSCAVSS